MSGDDVVAKVKLPPGARRLLDVDGGHGLYSIRFCRRHPRLMATVFDLPQALDAARQTIVAERMTDRVSVQRGNFAHDDLGSGYDVGQLPGKAMGPVAEAVARLQALNMLNAAASQAYAFEDIPGWLAAAGFAGARGKP